MLHIICKQTQTKHLSPGILLKAKPEVFIARNVLYTSIFSIWKYLIPSPDECSIANIFRGDNPDTALTAEPRHAVTVSHFQITELMSPRTDSRSAPRTAHSFRGNKATFIFSPAERKQTETSAGLLHASLDHEEPRRKKTRRLLRKRTAVPRNAGGLHTVSLHN